MPFFHHDDVDIFYTIHSPASEPEETPKSESRSKSENEDEDESKPKPKSPPVVLLHGWTCDSHDWSFQIPLLQSLKLTSIIPDLRGHGRSSTPLSTYTYHELASDIRALLHHLDLGPAVIIGHSLGAILASQLAVEDPDLVRALVLVDPVYGREPAPQDMIEAFVRDEAAPERVVAFFDALMYTEASLAWLKVWHARRALGADVHMVQRHFYEGNVLTEGNWMSKERAREFLKGRNVPRLVAFGSFMGDDGEAFERSLGVDEGNGDQVVLMHELGHWLHQEDPQAFNDLLEKWMRSNGFI